MSETAKRQNERGNMSIRVMLVDDHALMREGIKQLLEFDGSIDVIEEARDGEECLQKLIECNPQVLLLDIIMPRKDGIEVLEEIRKRKINVKVLILTVHNEIEYLLKAINMGVDGYILKDSESAELKKAIETVVSGESYIQPKLIPSLSAQDEAKEKIEDLTSRELEILIHVANGSLNKEIAKKLEISEQTVKNHMSRIFKKIGVCDRTQAAVFALKNDITRIS